MVIWRKELWNEFLLSYICEISKSSSLPGLCIWNDVFFSGPFGSWGFCRQLICSTTVSGPGPFCQGSCCSLISRHCCHQLSTHCHWKKVISLAKPLFCVCLTDGRAKTDDQALLSKNASKTFSWIWREFFKSNKCLNLNRQIDLILHCLTYECCNMTNFLWGEKCKINSSNLSFLPYFTFFAFEPWQEWKT